MSNDLFTTLKQTGHAQARWRDVTFDVRTSHMEWDIPMLEMRILQPEKEDEVRRGAWPIIEGQIVKWFHQQSLSPADEVDALHSLDWQAVEPRGAVPFEYGRMAGLLPRKNP